MDEERRRIRISLAGIEDTKQLLRNFICCGIIGSASCGGVLGSCGAAGVGAGSAGIATSLLIVVIALAGIAYENRQAARLLERFDQALGGDAEEFAVRNPMAQVRQNTEGYLEVRNADGSSLVGIREGSAAERETRAMEDRQRAGAGREESAPREEEELAVPRARSTRGLPAPSNRTQRGSRFRDIRDLPPLYPPINPAYAAFVADAGAAAGAGTGLFHTTAGYPRVGAIDDEREEEEEEEDRDEGFFARQRRRNPLYMGYRGQSPE